MCASVPIKVNLELIFQVGAHITVSDVVVTNIVHLLDFHHPIRLYFCFKKSTDIFACQYFLIARDIVVLKTHSESFLCLYTP